MADVTKLQKPIIQGEGKWFKFTYTQDGVAFPMPAKGTDIYTFIIKSKIGEGQAIFTADHIDDAQRTDGIIRANLPKSATKDLQVGNYYAEMEAVLTSDTDVDKKIVQFKVESKL